MIETISCECGKKVTRPVSTSFSQCSCGKTLHRCMCGMSHKTAAECNWAQQNVYPANFGGLVNAWVNQAGRQP